MILANAGINHHSVFRRSTLVLALFISGLFLGYVLLITANKLLSAEAFGLYYLAWTLINILSTPVVVMSFTTTFAKLHASDGKAGVAIGFRGVERWLLQWGGSSALIVMVALFLGSRAIGTESIAIMILVPLIALTGIWVESIRAAFQGMVALLRSGLAGICSHLLDLMIVGTILAVTGAVSAGLMGMLCANTLAALGLRTWLTRYAPRSAPSETSAIAPPKIGVPLRDFAGFTLFNMLINADIMVAYLILPPDQLGTYSASAVLPRAVVTLTQPIAQMAIALTAGNKDFGPKNVVIAKCILAIALVGGCAGLVMAFGMPILANFGLVLRHADNNILSTLAPAAMAFGIFRVILVLDLARGRILMPVVEVIALILFFLTMFFITPSTTENIARTFCALSWIICLISMILHFLPFTAPIFRKQSHQNYKGSY